MGEDFQELIESERAKRHDKDQVDFNNEVAGREVGRQKRFLSGEAQPGRKESKQEKHAEQLSRLAIMMQNAEYAVLYNETVDMVRDYASQSESEIDVAQSAVSVAGQKLEEITDNAAKLHPDGESVFLDKDGNAVGADGTPLSAEEAASVVWPDQAPTYEEYLSAKKSYADAQSQLDAWLAYQLYLGDVQLRLDDADNPLSSKELEQLQKDIVSRMPASVGVESDLSPSSVTPQVSTKGIEKPPI